MKLKKMLCLLLAVLLAFSMTACGEDAEYGKGPHSRTLNIKSWGIFCTGWVPLVSFGCINPSNYFIGAAELHYEPLDVHLARQAEGK